MIDWTMLSALISAAGLLVAVVQLVLRLMDLKSRKK